MDYLRQTKTLARFVLVWFVLSLGVAMASSLVAPKATQLVCSSGGAIKVVQADGDDETGTSHHLDCALCMAVALPPAPSSLKVAPVSPLSHALQPTAAAHIASATAPPLPSRGPPAL